MRLIIALLVAALATPALAQNSPGLHGSQSSGEQRTALLKLPCDPLHLLPGCASIITGGGASVTSESSDLWQRILAAALPDLIYAKALADAANTPGSKLRSQCLGAIITASQQASGANVKNSDGSPMALPDPHVITSIEQAAEVIDNLQSTAPIISSCAAAANAANVQVTQFLGALLAGVAIVVPK